MFLTILPLNTRFSLRFLLYFVSLFVLLLLRIIASRSSAQCRITGLGRTAIRAIRASVEGGALRGTQTIFDRSSDRIVSNLKIVKQPTSLLDTIYDDDDADRCCRRSRSVLFLTWC